MAVISLLMFSVLICFLSSSILCSCGLCINTFPPDVPHVKHECFPSYFPIVVSFDLMDCSSLNVNAGISMLNTNTNTQNDKLIHLKSWLLEINCKKLKNIFLDSMESSAEVVCGVGASRASKPNFAEMSEIKMNKMSKKNCIPTCSPPRAHTLHNKHYYNFKFSITRNA